MGDNSVKNSRIKIPKSHTHLHIIGIKSTKFQVNPMKDVGGVAETRSVGRTAGRTEGRTHTRPDEVISIAPPLRLRRVTKCLNNPSRFCPALIQIRRTHRHWSYPTLFPGSFYVLSLVLMALFIVYKFLCF